MVTCVYVYSDGYLLTYIAKVLFDLVYSPTIAHLVDNLLGKVSHKFVMRMLNRMVEMLIALVIDALWL